MTIEQFLQFLTYFLLATGAWTVHKTMNSNAWLLEAIMAVIFVFFTIMCIIQSVHPMPSIY